MSPHRSLLNPETGEVTPLAAHDLRPHDLMISMGVLARAAEAAGWRVNFAVEFGGEPAGTSRLTLSAERTDAT